MATEEIATFMNKKRNQIDAELLVPYLVLVTVTAFHELYMTQKNQQLNHGSSQTKSQLTLDPRMEGFRVRLLMMEHFSTHRASMAIQDYSFVTFKEVE